MPKRWTQFFTPEASQLLQQSISLALEEDGPELTSKCIFNKDKVLTGIIRAKEKTIVTGLPLVALVLKQWGAPFTSAALVSEGSTVEAMTNVAEIVTTAEALLKTERVILNYITHLSGISNLTAQYVKELDGTGVKLLDTRKTLPGLRWVEKYAVQAGGGYNHRMNLTEMLMLKDNHIDAAGSIGKACEQLRQCYNPCPPIEVECRTLDDVRQALDAKADRIMLDNMSGQILHDALLLIPSTVEAEISGGVTLDNIRQLAVSSPRRPDFISVGRLTHSAKAADFSMTIKTT